MHRPVSAIPHSHPHARAFPPGKVYLIGAGPGDVDLLTLKAARLIEQAEVVLVDDLVGADVLALCPAARVIAVGKRGGARSTSQHFIDRLLVREARAGRRVVRLKGGDVSLFGRAAEEIAALQAAAIDFEVVPGVTAGLAAAAAAQCSLTHRQHAHGVAFITAQGSDGVDVAWPALAAVARDALTLVVYMAVARVTALRESLLAGGLPGHTPVLAVENASRPDQRIVATHLAAMADDFAARRLLSPAVLLIGGAMKAYANPVLAAAAAAEATG
ncbi:MAG: uroporphyrinogen-III C-methyltransferase [Burkholderiales bacterium]|nr:uroporphyrinogen-III C-methyltransferase [Burkholderiales bacterium]